MTVRRKGWSEWTVRFVALLFVVHGALLAVSQGASADSIRRDQFGNVLCLASAEPGHGGTHRTSDSHADMMSCCTLGCSMFTGVATPPAISGEPVGAFAALPSPAFTSFAERLASVPKSPRTTRGPPVAA